MRSPASPSFSVTFPQVPVACSPWLIVTHQKIPLGEASQVLPTPQGTYPGSTQPWMSATHECFCSESIVSRMYSAPFSTCEGVGVPASQYPGPLHLQLDPTPPHGREMTTLKTVGSPLGVIPL